MVDSDTRSVRLATPHDVPWIMGLAKAFYDYSEYKKYPFDYDGTLAYVFGLIDAKGKGRALLVSVDDHDIPVGMVWAEGVKQPWTTVRIASEVVWWVAPAWRASRRGLELLGAYEDWAKLQGYQILINGLHGASKELLEPIYLRRNYQPIETYYIKELT